MSPLQTRAIITGNRIGSQGETLMRRRSRRSSDKKWRQKGSEIRIISGDNFLQAFFLQHLTLLEYLRANFHFSDKMRVIK